MTQRLGMYLLIAALVVLSAGCATRNMLPDGRGNTVMLAGNDPVSYHTGLAPARGDPGLRAEWDKGIYFFANANNRDLFMKSPEKFAPQYGGFCSNGAPYSILLGGSADAYKIIDGRLFMFSGPDSKKYWEMDQKKNIELGDHYWQTEMRDTWSAKVQSYRRIVIKVPHYKTGKELEADWQRRQSKG